MYFSKIAVVTAVVALGLAAPVVVNDDLIQREAQPGTLYCWSQNKKRVPCPPVVEVEKRDADAVAGYPWKTNGKRDAEADAVAGYPWKTNGKREAEAEAVAGYPWKTNGKREAVAGYPWKTNGKREPEAAAVAGYPWKTNGKRDAE